MSEALRALLERATKRPWRAMPYKPNSDRGNVYIEGPAGWTGDPVCSTYEHSTGQTNEANAALIAIAVNHIKELVDAVELLNRDRGDNEAGFATSLLAKIEADAKETP